MNVLLIFSLTLVLLAHVLGPFTWIEALLVGAALSPTDPVFAAAIVGREEVPPRVRHLLNVESGLNDGLALPIVLVLLTAASGSVPHLPVVLGELGLGLAVGCIVPFALLWVAKSDRLNATESYLPLYGFAIGLLLLAVTSLTHANTCCTPRRTSPSRACSVTGATRPTVGRASVHRRPARPREPGGRAYASLLSGIGRQVRSN